MSIIQSIYEVLPVSRISQLIGNTRQAVYKWRTADAFPVKYKFIKGRSYVKQIDEIVSLYNDTIIDLNKTKASKTAYKRIRTADVIAYSQRKK
jgi:hypothetical protein